MLSSRLARSRGQLKIPAMSFEKKSQTKRCHADKILFSDLGAGIHAMRSESLSVMLTHITQAGLTYHCGNMGLAQYGKSAASGPVRFVEKLG